MIPTGCALQAPCRSAASRARYAARRKVDAAWTFAAILQALGGKVDDVGDKPFTAYLADVENRSRAVVKPPRPRPWTGPPKHSRNDWSRAASLVRLAGLSSIRVVLSAGWPWSYPVQWQSFLWAGRSRRRNWTATWPESLSSCRPLVSPGCRRPPLHHARSYRLADGENAPGGLNEPSATSSSRQRSTRRQGGYVASTILRTRINLWVRCWPSTQVARCVPARCWSPRRARRW